MQFKPKKVAPNIGGIKLKKQFGQHFLQDQSVVDCMINAVKPNDNIFEIGCGNGFLTKSILKMDFTNYWIFEIDPEWAEYVKKNYSDNRMTIFCQNFLDTDMSVFKEYGKWTLLANLPYQVTFPIFYKLLKNRDLIQEGVVMIQEEVAQKIVKTSGRGYGFNSLYLNHFFDWKLLVKIPPTSFYPAPKVVSRLIYFKPKQNIDIIIKEEEFWQFIKQIFSQPRRTIKNNLLSYHYDLSKLSQDTLNLRAQQLSKKDLLDIWNSIVS